MKLLNTFLSDGKRLFDSHHLLYGSIVVCLYMMALRLEDLQGDSAVYIVTVVLYSMGFVLVIMISYEVFGNCFLEDFKSKYIYQELLCKGNLFFYTASKTFWIFVSSMFCVAFGVTLFSCISKIGNLWTDELTAYLVNTPYGILYKNGHYLLYLFLSGLQFGILAGMMSMVGSLVSLFINNKLLAGASAVIFVYVCNLIKGIFWHGKTYNLFSLFLSTQNMVQQADGWIVHCIVLGLLFYGIGTLLIFIRIRWRLRHE